MTRTDAHTACPEFVIVGGEGELWCTCICFLFLQTCMPIRKLKRKQCYSCITILANAALDDTIQCWTLWNMRIICTYFILNAVKYLNNFSKFSNNSSEIVLRHRLPKSDGAYDYVKWSQILCANIHKGLEENWISLQRWLRVTVCGNEPILMGIDQSLNLLAFLASQNRTGLHRV